MSIIIQQQLKEEIEQLLLSIETEQNIQLDNKARYISQINSLVIKYNFNEKKKRICKNCGKTGHNRRSCVNKCESCGLSGHNVRCCVSDKKSGFKNKDIKISDTRTIETIKNKEYWVKECGPHFEKAHSKIIKKCRKFVKLPVNKVLIRLLKNKNITKCIKNSQYWTYLFLDLYSKLNVTKKNKNNYEFFHPYKRLLSHMLIPENKIKYFSRIYVSSLVYLNEGYKSCDIWIEEDKNMVYFKYGFFGEDITIETRTFTDIKKILEIAKKTTLQKIERGYKPLPIHY